MPFQRVSIIKENTRKNSPTDLYVGENSYRSHCSLNIGGGKKFQITTKRIFGFHWTGLRWILFEFIYTRFV
jgi:hypothetical protein